LLDIPIIATKAAVVSPLFYRDVGGDRDAKLPHSCGNANRALDLKFVLLSNG
jgi:hypothetical protein